MKKKKYLLLTALLVLALAGSGGYIAWKSLDYQRGAETYEAAARAAGLPAQAQPSASPNSPEEVDPWAAALMETDLDALRAVNEEVVGWLMIPETELSYPLLQGADNQYYLNHTWKGERNSVGAVFMEHLCDSKLTDFNTIIYGHRMNNDSMFGVLANYREMDFLRAHPSVYLASEDGVRVYDIFAAGEVGREDIVYGLDIADPEVKRTFLDFSLDNSVIDTEITPDTEDQVLTLSTCVSGWGRSAKRWTVQAVLSKEYERRSST